MIYFTWLYAFFVTFISYYYQVFSYNLFQINYGILCFMFIVCLFLCEALAACNVFVLKHCEQDFLHERWYSNKMYCYCYHYYYFVKSK